MDIRTSKTIKGKSERGYNYEISTFNKKNTKTFHILSTFKVTYEPDDNYQAEKASEITKNFKYNVLSRHMNSSLFDVNIIVNTDYSEYNLIDEKRTKFFIEITASLMESKPFKDVVEELKAFNTLCMDSLVCSLENNGFSIRK